MGSLRCVMTKGLVFFAIISSISSISVMGQATTTSRMVGNVTDLQGSSIAQAQIVARNEDTQTKYQAVSNEQGGWVIPSVPSGRYTVTITAQNFKTVLVKDVKVDVGVPATVNASLEVGQIADQVVVSGGGEVLQSQTANVATTISGRQINELPFVARDAVQLVLTQPGVSTPGTPRTSSMNGLPKGAINMTLNGMNIQDNFLKSSDGFFATIQPKADAVEEVTISTATPGAESGGEGAVQVKFVTKSGTNQIHGGGFWQHRNTALNSNFYFNNLNGLPREKVLLNQYGGHVGGPIVKDKLFYFFNYEGFRLPQTFSRVGLFGTPVTVLSPSAQQGIFTYKGTHNVVRSVNFYDVASRSGLNIPTTPDPTLLNLLTQSYQLSTAGGQVTDRIASNTDFLPARRRIEPMPPRFMRSWSDG